jgi:hypothetical protein
MPSPVVIKRRGFLRSLLLILIFARCKKDVLTPGTNSAPGKTITNVPPVAVINDQYLGQYTITEIGPALNAEPTFMQSINGYVDQQSYHPGDTVNVYLSGPANDSAVVPLLNTQRTAILSVTTPIATQTIKSAKPWVDGFMYDKTFSFKIPEYFTSGIYTWMGNIPFICKAAPNQPVDITVVYPSNTLNAYNFAGGKSLYVPDMNNRATVVSFMRSNIVYYIEFYKWIDKQQYNINYISDSDLEDYSQIQNSKLVIISGHSEYWTRQSRLNIDKYIDSGKNVLLLSGNNMWWQVRYNKSKNLMICYKGIVENKKGEELTEDPLTGTLYSTVNWVTPSLNYPIISSIGADYRYSGFGYLQSKIGYKGFKIVKASSPILAGSGLKNGDILNMPSTEYDGTAVKSFFGPGSSQIPVLDNSVIKFDRVELLGYDFATNTYPATNNQGFGTFMVGRKSPTSGTIVNGASMDWCYYIVEKEVQTITKNMIDLSLAGASLFSD